MQSINEIMMIFKIKKRDGRIIDFNENKIKNAILRASLAVGKSKEIAKNLSEDLSSYVVLKIERKFMDIVPTVEDVQDLVENTLIENNYPNIAKTYILYRQNRKDCGKNKTFLGVKDDLKLNINAIRVLEKRYLLKDKEGIAKETPSQLFKRVAKTVAKVDNKYSKGDVKRLETEFYKMMSDLEFLPNSPALMNAGTRMNQLAACFVLPVNDSMDGIFQAVKEMAIIQKSGGGTGFDFSRLRPEGDMVQSTKGIASGPVSFMKVFDTATDVTKQGGKRRGANMGILRVDHPDIMSFITAKSKEEIFKNFNLSVGLTKKFMDTVSKNQYVDLVNPRTNKKVKKIKARELFDLIVSNAWLHGDPGLIFLDEINKHNPVPSEKISAMNPCGEMPLLPYESCVLGSINLSRMIKNSEVNFDKLEKTVKLGVHFLDNLIDANKYPLENIEKTTKNNRKIGLGVMGFADMLIQLEIPYDSDEAVNTAKKIMKFINEKAREESVKLGKERGSFPNFKKSVYYKNFKTMRNATITSIAPTGSISIIAGCSSGIEPLFAVSFIRNIMEGTRLLEVNKLFEKTANKKGFYSTELMLKIAKKGSIKSIKEIPNNIKRIFVTALDIEPEWHVKIQAAFQMYTDNSVSKTVNMPEWTTPNDVKKAFMLAYKLKCKGITVYRYGSKPKQVLYIGTAKKNEEHISAESEYSGGCPAEPYCES